MSSRVVQTSTVSSTTSTKLQNQTSVTVSPLDTKAIRSFEHSRQKHLHPQDRHNKRFRKYRQEWGNSLKCYDFRPGQFNGTRFLAPLDTPLNDLADEDRGMDDAESEVWRAIYENEEDTVKGVGTAPRTFEVDFNDLIRPRRAKKGAFRAQGFADCQEVK